MPVESHLNDGVSEIFPVEPETTCGVFLKLLTPAFSTPSPSILISLRGMASGIDLCANTMHQVMTGSASETVLNSATALREEPQKDQ